MSFIRYEGGSYAKKSMGTERVGITKNCITLSRVLMEHLKDDGHNDLYVSVLNDADNNKIKVEFFMSHTEKGSLKMKRKDGGGMIGIKSAFAYFGIVVDKSFKAPIVELGENYIVVSLAKENL